MAEDTEKSSTKETPDKSSSAPPVKDTINTGGPAESHKEADSNLRQRSITSFFSTGGEKDSGNFLRPLLRTMLRGGLGHLIILGFLFLLFLVFILAVREVLLPFILAIVIAYVLSPVVNRLHEIKLGKLNLPRWAAVVLIYLTGGFFIYTFSVMAMPRFSGELKNLIQDTPQFFRTASQEYLPRANEKLNVWLDSLRSPFDENQTVHDPLREIEDVDATVGHDSDDSPIGLRQADTQDASDEEVQDSDLRALKHRDKKGQAGSLNRQDKSITEAQPVGKGEMVLLKEGMELDFQMLGEGHFRLKPVKSTESVGDDSSPTFDLDKNINEYMDSLLTRSEAYILQAFSLGQSLVKRVIGSIMTLVLTFMIAAFLLSDVPRVTGFFRSLIPMQYRIEYDEILKGVNIGLGGVIRGQLMICLVNGTLTGVGLILLGVKYASILALLAAVLSLIPIFGTIISSIPAVAIALTQSFGLGVAVLLWIIIIHLIEANILNPKIIGTSAKIHPVWVVFALVAGEHTYGLFGALLAVPIFSIFQTLFLYFRQRAYSSGGEQ